MSNDKWIMIVDDEQPVLMVRKNSLKRIDPENQVITASNGLLALEQLTKHSFKIIITDYKMAGMNGLELLDQIKAQQPSARVILMTAYGNTELQTEALRKQAYRYLTKPFELVTFRQVIKDALDDFAINRPGILMLSDERYRQINEILVRLQSDVGARCTFLIDPDGHVITRTGQISEIPIAQIASLISAGVASLIEVGHMMDGNPETINLMYREGTNVNLYAINIGRQFLLLIIIDRSTISSKLGSIWFYSQKTALELGKRLNEKESASPEQMLGKNIYQAIDAEMDKMFEDIPPDTPVVDSIPSVKGINLNTEKPSSVESIAPNANSHSSQTLLSFEEALEAGIISKQITSGEVT